MTQAHKHNSMPNTVHSTLTTVARKKHPTISRFFHGKNQPQPQRQESFAPTPLSPEMKHHPPYHSDPNLLAEENEPAKENAKKPRAWKWPFPRNKNQRELPGQNDNEIQPIAIHNVVRNFPDTPSEDPYAPSDSHFAGSHVPEPESLVIAFQDKNLVTEIEAVEEVHNPSSDYERPDPLLRPVSSPLAPSTSRALRRVSSGKRLKKTLKSQANSEDLPSPHTKSQPSTELTNGDTSSLYKQAIHESIKQPIRHKKSLMLCDYCLMTVSTPALFATGEKGKGKEITFRFSPLAKIGLLRGAILREFLERTQASPSLLSTLHLCYFNDRDRAWIWLDEKLPLFTYNLQRECRLDLKPSTPHSIGVRIVLPDIERTMMVSFDQFTIVHDLLNQVLNAQKLRIKDTTGFSLFHVRLRIMLDPNRSITYYELQSHDTLECRIAPGKMDGTCITIFVPQTDSHHTIEVCLDQTVGDLISLLIRQLPQCDFSHWYHSALYYKPKEQGKGLWLDDYKYLYSYSIGTHEILEFKARYRPLVFDLRLYSSYAKSDDDQSVTLLLSQNIIVEQVLEMLHAICSFEFSAEFYGLYQHNGIQIANEVRLCEFLDNIANRRYEDTVKVHMIPLLLEVELIEEVSDDLENCRFEYLVDFSRPCRDLRSLLARRFGVKNKHACVLRFEDQDLDLKESLFDNSVTDKARIEFVHKNLRNQDSVESPVIDYVNNGCACIITPDLLADLPPNKMELGRSKSLMLTDMPNIWDDEIESEKNLRFERGSHNVSAATFNKLVIRLTSDQNLDLGFVKTFLLTYRAYTSPKILLQKLIERYNVIRSPHKSMNEFNMSKTKIQLRVINALKFWLELGFDFQDDGSLQRQMLDFIENVLYDDQPKMCRKLRILLLTIQGKIDQSDKQNVCVKPPPIKVNKASLPTSSLIELDPEEVARQLTLIDFNIYSKIKPFELLNQAWAKPKYKHRAKNVHCLVDRLNNMTLWVATVVLSYDEEFQRAKAISAFVKIAYHLYRLHNFSTLMAVYCGVQHGSITRLYRTWGKVDRATNKLLEDLTIVCDPQLGHSKMREEMLNADPPCLPYIIALFILQLFNCILLEVSSIINCTALDSMRFKLQLLGLFMRDLTLIDEGNPNLMQDGLINFLKCDLIYKSIRDVQMYQQQNYNFEVEPSISASLSSFQFVDEKTAYEHSEIFEPRVRRV